MLTRRASSSGSSQLFLPAAEVSELLHEHRQDVSDDALLAIDPATRTCTVVRIEDVEQQLVELDDLAEED